MRTYDRAEPLIVIHVPKAAGTSVMTIFRRWFGSGLYLNYFDERTGSPPPKRDLHSLHSISSPVAVYGHFGRTVKGLSIEDYYPDARQFVTILRDPFELVISRYYHIRKVGSDWLDQSRVPKGDLREYLMNNPPNMLNHFPRKVTRENYRAMMDEFFIDVGLMERLPETLRRFADKLGMPFRQDWLPHLNATPRDQADPHGLRDEYAERHALDFEVYDYVASRF